MRHYRRMMIAVLSLAGVMAAAFGCGSMATDSADRTSVTKPSQEITSQPGVAFQLDCCAIQASNLKLDADRFSVGLVVSGDRAVRGEYTLEIRSAVDSQVIRHGEAVLRDDRGTLFGLAYSVDLQHDRVTVRQYMESDTVSLVRKTGETGWTVEYSGTGGKRDSFTFSSTSLDELVETAALYEELESAQEGEAVEAAVTDEQRILLEQFAEGKAFFGEALRDWQQGLKDNRYAQLMFDVLEDEEFGAWLDGQLGSARSDGGDESVSIDLSPICDIIDATGDIICIINGEDDDNCQLLKKVARICRWLDFFI